MRALTLTQPWAGLVAAGIKLVENRSRPMIKAEDFGQRFAVHASRNIDHGVYSRIRADEPELFPHTMTHDPATWPEWYARSLVTRAVIAVATIVRVVDAYDDLTAELGDQRRWFSGPIGYVLRDVRALATPVPCRGWQGFWRMTDETELAVTEQLSEAA